MKKPPRRRRTVKLQLSKADLWRLAVALEKNRGGDTAADLRLKGRIARAFNTRGLVEGLWCPWVSERWLHD